LSIRCRIAHRDRAIAQTRCPDGRFHAAASASRALLGGSAVAALLDCRNRLLTRLTR
jgi:hypothetical protein